MHSLHKTTSLIATAAFLITPLLLTAQNMPQSENLAQLQAQAKQDMQAFQDKWPEGMKVLSATLAVAPLLRKQAAQYAQQVEQAIQGKRPVFPYGAEEVLPAARQENFRTFAQLLRDGKYEEAYTLMQKIDFKDWDFLRKTRGTDFNLPNEIENFLSRQVSKQAAATRAAQDLSLGKFFEKPDPQILKDLEPYIKQLRDAENWRVPGKYLANSPFAKQFASAEEFNQFIRLLESTNERFIFRDLEENYALKYILQARDIILQLNKQGIKPSNFFLRSVKTTCSYLFRHQNILMLTAVAAIGLSAANSANAQDLQMSKRLQENFDLFLQANAAELAAIEKNATAKQAVVDMTGALHQLRLSVEQNPQHLQQLQQTQQTQQHL